MSTQAVIDTNDSRTGSRSRFNAVKHGFTAATTVLPGEDADAFDGKVALYKKNLQTRNELEDDLAASTAEWHWRLERLNRVENARLTEKILTGPVALALQQKKEVAALEKRLFFDRQGPIELYPHSDFLYNRPRTSWSKTADDPDDPALLVAELESTLAGCQTLLARWAELRALLELGLGFQSHDKLKATRLLGKQPLQVISSPELREMFLACYVLEPQYEHPFQELRCEIDEARFERMKAALDRLDLASIMPADETAARSVLLGIVDRATERLRLLEAERQEVADLVDGLQPDILSHDESKAGEQIRRHQATCTRMMHRNLEEIRKNRRDEAHGWGNTRNERQRRKAARRGLEPCDLRMAADEAGMIRSAHSDEGNLEEVPARYESESGRELVGEPRPLRDFDDDDPPRVPDFARWNSSGGVAGAKRKRSNRKVENIDLSWAYELSAARTAEQAALATRGRVASDATGPPRAQTAKEMEKDDDERMSQGAQAAPGFVTVAEEAEPTAVVPLMLIESQERAKTQNEMDGTMRNGDEGGGRALEPGEEKTFGQPGGDVRDPRRTETGDWNSLVHNADAAIRVAAVL